MQSRTGGGGGARSRRRSRLLHDVGDFFDSVARYRQVCISIDTQRPPTLCEFEHLEPRPLAATLSIRIYQHWIPASASYNHSRFMNAHALSGVVAPASARARMRLANMRKS